MKIRACILTYCGPTPATDAIGAALLRRGHEAVLLSPLECSVGVSQGRSVLSARGEEITGVNAVLTRCVGYFHNGRAINRNVEAAAATALARQGAIAVNRPERKLVANDKILSLAVLASAGILVPPTEFISCAEEARQAARAMRHPSIIKLGEGQWGAGVMRVDSEASFRSVADALLNLGQALLVQPCLLREGSRQLRVLVLGSEVLAAYETRAASGDFRGNLHAGAAPAPATLPPGIAELSISSARALGLEFAGVDLIIDDGAAHVLEVNPAPGFSFAQAMPGVDVAGALVRHLETALWPERAAWPGA